MLQYSCVRSTLQNIKKFVSEIVKRIRSVKSDMWEVPPIEECFKTKIKDKYNLTPKPLPVD